MPLKKIKNIECRYQHVIEDMHADIYEIKGDVKSLLKFKWQIIGGAGAIGVVVSAIGAILSFKVF